MGWIPKITGKKTMINVDGMEWLRPKWKGPGAAYFRLAAKLATKLYDLIITDADAMRDVYLKEFKQDSLVIAYGAPPFKKSDPSLLNPLGIIPDDYYLIVGRLIPDNNADLIIKAYLESASKKKLVVVGDVPYRDKYAEDLKKLAGEKVHFVGYVRNSDVLMALYQNCFSYIHGHKYGGTNPAMLKAMSNNCSILALDTSFNREMLTNGKFGLLFEENTGSIKECMKNLEKDELLVKQLRSTVSSGLTDKYNWDCVTEAYQKVMVELYHSKSKK
jgi:glycosyltransferase involved in cell wall biosynthesis